MPFGFNFGSNKSVSTSQSDAYGYSRSGSTSVSDSRSTQTSRAGSSQEIAFADLFASLYGGAFGASARVADQVPVLQSRADTLFSSGAGFLDQLTGGDAGTAYLEETIGSESPFLDQQIAGLSEDVGRFFDEELLPGVTDRAVGAGQLGGGRQGVAEGRAIDTAAREFRRGATDLRVQDLQRRDQAATSLAGFAQQGAGAALSSLPGLLGLAESGAYAELGPSERLAAILGGPQALTTSFSESDAASIAQAIADSFAQSEDFATSTSRSTSKGKSVGFSFGA